MAVNINDIVTFSYKIEDIVYMKDIPYMEAVVLYCEENNIELEIAASLISDNIKYKIQLEAQDLHYLPKSNTTKLPF